MRFFDVVFGLKKKRLIDGQREGSLYFKFELKIKMASDPSNYSWPGVLEFLYVPDAQPRPSTKKSPSRKTCGFSKRKNSLTSSNNSKVN
jgi:hypothetical protein